jgi:hypothetical protein
MNRRRLVVLLLVVAILASGCSKKKYDSFKVVDFVDATVPHSYRISYEVTEGKTKVDVQGIIQDDFRYKLQLSLGDEPAAEQVVVDDAVALRFFDSKLVSGYTDPAVTGKVKTDTDVPGATVFDALGAGRWVLDDAGAPSPILETLAEGEKGVETPKDPLFDARTALSYVRRVANSSYFVKYDPESINPTYRTDEDPFPVPGDGSGVDRYDSIVFPLPSAAAATSNRQLPAAQNFRKMAVYVKKGLVIGVREFIGMTPRQAKQLQDYEEALLKATANDAVLAGFRKQIAAMRDNPDALADFLLGGLNTFITSIGDQPVRFRTMSFEIADVDAVTTAVKLPSDIVKGDLAVIRNLGRKPVDDGSTDESSSSASTTTTTTAPATTSTTGA